MSGSTDSPVCRHNWPVHHPYPCAKCLQEENEILLKERDLLREMLDNTWKLLMAEKLK